MGPPPRFPDLSGPPPRFPDLSGPSPRFPDLSGPIGSIGPTGDNRLVQITFLTN